MPLKKALSEYCEKRIAEFDQISEDRKLALAKIAAYLNYKEDEPIQLLFVCTHNSRRSMFGQIWAKVAAHYYGFTNVETFSGGTEITALHGNVAAALMYLGFDAMVEGDNDNAIHNMIFDKLGNASICFSKLIDDPYNPRDNFGAIVTCDQADKNCPVILGAELRVSLSYEDPKASDGTDMQMETYLKTSRQIATEMLYLFHLST